MASKLQIITAMFNDEVGKVTNSLDNWTFLVLSRKVCKFFKKIDN